MFKVLGTLVSRGWPIFLAGWLGLSIWGSMVAPPWSEVAASGQFAFLPADSPSIRGKDLLNLAFPHQLPSNIVLVLSREDGVLGEEDRKFIARVLVPELRTIAEESATNEPANGDRGRRPETRIRSLADKGEGELLKSADNKATLVVVELAGEFLANRDWPTIEKVEQLVARLPREQKVPPGLDIRLTGNAVVGRDVRQAESRSGSDIELWTTILVIALLLVIYRAPLLALIPLATVFVAVNLSLKFLAILAQHRLVELSETIRIYVTVLGYGAGVDYCLFLIARYQEGLEEGLALADAVAKAIGRVGATLVASAGTVICGIGMLVFARFGKYHQAGICIPFSLLVVLASALTFSPALLRLTGRWAFWPTRRAAGAPSPDAPGTLQPKKSAGVWEKVAGALVARPGTIWLVSMAIMAPFVVVAVVHYYQVDYGIDSELPKTAASSSGLEALEEHFPAGTIGPVTVLISNHDVYFGTVASDRLLKAVSDALEEQRDILHLADIRSLAHPFGTTRHGKETLANISVSTAAAAEVVRHLSFQYYVSTAPDLVGHVTRIELVSDLDPLSQESIGNITRVEEAVRAALSGKLENSHVDFAGPTASLRDLRDVTSSDFRRIEALVPAVVFVILVIILRQFVISLYLVASVVVSFLATLGVTFLVFRFTGPAGFVGLDWKVPVFLFTILVAVGEDYNIFLLTRIREEEKEHGPVGGVTAALVKTGGVISSCGFIMAGTFASLLSGSLHEMKQMGFALAFGVLLDTLVVRPILVPAFLIWLRRGEGHFVSRDAHRSAGTALHAARRG